MSRLQTLRDILKKYRYSFTKKRIVVFNQLLMHSPVSAAHLANICQPGVDRATTYRTLDLFERLGIVKRIWQGLKSKYELTDLFNPHHHHITCLNCKRVFTIKSPTLEKILHNLSYRQNVAPIDHQVEINGYCKNCRSYSSLKGRSFEYQQTY